MEYKTNNIVDKYNELGSIKKVADFYKINEKTAKIWLTKHGVNTSSTQGARKHKYNESYFEYIDTEEKAYWLGFIMADGCIYQGSDGKSLRLQINLKSSDVNHLEDFQKAIGSNYKIQIKKVKTSEAALLKINSTQMCKDLMNHGVLPRKSDYCDFPKLDKPFVRHFIRGYFDGDGSISKQKKSTNSKTYRICIVGSLDFLNGLVKELRPSINFKVELIQRSKADSIVLHKTEELQLFYKYLYDNSTILLKRKKDTFDKFLLGLCPLEE